MPNKHQWDVTPKEAAQIQSKLVDQIQFAPLPDNIKSVAGADLSFNNNLKKTKSLNAIITVLSFPELEHIELKKTVKSVSYPYIPGLLSFREGPALMEAFEELDVKPDVIIFDGQGIAHPRGLGLAAHLGVLLDIPSIGCAKSKLVGDFDEPGIHKGAREPLFHKGEEVGAVLRTRTNVKPVFVSPGHRCNISDAADFVLNCTTRFRLPEPTRQAHLYVTKMRKKLSPIVD